MAPRATLAADLNGDHKTDLIVISATSVPLQNGPATGLVALLGNGDGTFQQPLSISGCLQPTAIQDVDLNGDGIPDIEATCLTGGFLVPTGASLLVVLGNGDGTFGAGTVYDLAFTPWAVLTTGDFNRDGKPDIAVATEGTVTVFLNDGKANLKIQRSTGQPWNFAPGIAAGDFNGDGLLDLAVSGEAGAISANGLLAILLGNGDGSFKAASTSQTSLPGQLAAMDLNGDGHTDLVEGLSSIVFFPGRGDGTFETGFPFGSLGNAGFFALADFASSGTLGIAGLNNAMTMNGTQAMGNAVILPRAVWPTLTLANVSAAGFGLGPLAAGSIATGFGHSLSAQTAQATSTPPLTLGGAAVSVMDSAGIGRAAQLYYVSQTQVNYVIPADAAAGLATVTITANGQTTATGQIQIVPVAPALFVVNANNLAAAYVLRVSQNGERTFQSIYQADANGDITALPIDLGSAADTVFLSLYGTGIGQRTASEVTATLGGAYTPIVTYAGPQGSQAGLDQINLQLPASLTFAAPRSLSLQLTVDGQPSNQVTLVVQ